MWRTADEEFSGLNGMFMRTNTCLVEVFDGRPSRRYSTNALATAGSSGSVRRLGKMKTLEPSSAVHAVGNLGQEKSHPTSCTGTSVT